MQFLFPILFLSRAGEIGVNNRVTQMPYVTRANNKYVWELHNNYTEMFGWVYFTNQYFKAGRKPCLLIYLYTQNKVNSWKIAFWHLHHLEIPGKWDLYISCNSFFVIIQSSEVKLCIESKSQILKMKLVSYQLVFKLISLYKV